jgi:hypothetical protein
MRWRVLGVAPVVVVTLLCLAPCAASASAAWSKATIDRGYVLTSVSCPATSFCAAVDLSGRGLTYDGKSWRRPERIDRRSLLHSVSCASARSCVAVGGDGNAVIYSANEWKVQRKIDGTNDVVSVSCPRAAAFCAAVDSDAGNAVIDDRSRGGNNWSAPDMIDGLVNALTSVSCVSAKLCVAVDMFGNTYVSHGGGWGAPVPIDSGADLPSVSCVSALFCLAVGTADAMIYNGSSWSSPSSVDMHGALTAVSCASKSFCIAVDDTGNAFIYNGSSWSAPERIDRGNVLESVSCHSSSFCVAVDNVGNAFRYGPYRHSGPQPRKNAWPLPNPCRLPSATIDDFVGVGTTSQDEKLTKRHWNSRSASATCTFYPQLSVPHSTIYVGYVRPPEPSSGVTVTKIPGWHGAELIASTQPNYLNNDYFWVVTFKRTFHKHVVWGQTWWRGSSCTPAQPAVAGIAKVLYRAIGPGPPVSVPPPHHVPTPCG